jgi:hypothetical protein
LRPRSQISNADGRVWFLAWVYAAAHKFAQCNNEIDVRRNQFAQQSAGCTIRFEEVSQSHARIMNR